MSVMVLASGMWSCRPDYDLDKRFPTELGTSIYQTLKKGFEVGGKKYTFKYYVAIIDSLKYADVLDRTGSKTLFAADDAAFERFLDKCPLAGNRKIEFKDLTQSQMKMIFYGSMLDNVYQVAALGNTSNKNTGDCMRRVPASGTYDTIRVMSQAEMPSGPYWNYLKNDPSRSAGIAIMQDGSEKPLLLFSHDFLKYNAITPDDYDFLFNQGKYGDKPGRSDNDASINGIRIEYQNKKCFNGFIHVMEDVVYLLPSMAEYLASGTDSTFIFSSILDRFSAPYVVRKIGNNVFPSGDLTTYDSHVSSIKSILGSVIKSTPELVAALSSDTVYTRLYLSMRNQGADTIKLDPFRKEVQRSSLLKFDPGWNAFTSSPYTDLNKDMGVMIVPTDQTLTKWWLQGAGQEMRAKYGLQKYKGKSTDPSAWEPWEVAEDMDSVDINVIVKLVNNGMLSSFVNSVPSKFKNVLNDAQDPMFDNPAQAKKDISKVVMCCNGAIYLSNFINTPTSYRSVAYPALVNDKLSVVDWAIEDNTLALSYYLNSMATTYSLFLPEINLSDTLAANSELKGKLVWIDPTSYGIKKYKEVSSNSSKRMVALAFGVGYGDKKHAIYAYAYNVDDNFNIEMAGGQPVKAVNDRITDEAWLRNRLGDMLDYHIVIGNVETDSVNTSDFSYFRTKGGGAVRFKKGSFNPETEFGNMTVQGGWQVETGDEVKIIDRFDMVDRARGNGVTYVINKPLQTSRMSVFDILDDSVKYPEFNKFYKLMNSTSFFSSSSNTHQIGSRNCVDYFSTYNYTIYVPTSASIDTLIKHKKLYEPTYLKNFDNEWKGVHDSIDTYYGPDEKASADSAWQVKMIELSRSLRGATASEPNTASDSSFHYKTNFSDVKREELKNFIKYHIQDNSLYINAYPGWRPYGDFIEYQTAYMREYDKQYIKLEAKLDQTSLTLRDANGNIRHVVTDRTATGGAPYYNIMCREYEMSKSSYTKVNDVNIETSSYAVIHLIDEPLCNGEVIF